MALSLAGYQSRITSQLALLGSFSSISADLIKGALVDLLTAVQPRISATLAVNAAALTYTKPATIDIIEAIEDEDGDAVVYSVDDLEGELTLQDAPSGSVNYKVYGSPDAVLTNATTIIAGLNERYDNALWAFIRARCHEQAESDRADAMRERAKQEAHELLMYLNTAPGYRDRTIAITDVAGKQVGDASSSDGLDTTYNDMGETPEY